MSDPIILSDRAVLTVSGDERYAFLNTLLSADVSETVGEARFAALLTPQGKVLADVLCFTAEDRVYIDYPADSDLPKRLRMYKLRAAVGLDLQQDWQVAVTLQRGATPGGATVVFDDPRSTHIGQRLLGPSLHGSNDRRAYDAARIAAVVPESATDLEPNKALLLENGFERLGGVDFRKGCFVGQEVTARMKYRNLGKKRLMSVRCTGASDTTPLTPGAAIMAGERAAGSVLTAVGGEALALMRHEYADQALTSDGHSINITADPDAAVSDAA